MIISHSKKFAFFRIPKTGSVTAEYLLRLSGALDLSQDVLTSMPVFALPHINIPQSLVDLSVTNLSKVQDLFDPNVLTEAVLAHFSAVQALQYGLITEGQLREYNCFAFVREPLSRYASAFAYQFGMSTTVVGFRQWVTEGHSLGLLERMQSDYACPGMTFLRFDAFDTGMRRMLQVLGAPEGWPVEIPHMNSRRGAWRPGNLYDLATRTIVEEKFARDIELWKEIST